MVNRLDWDAMLGQLETQRASAAQELEDIDAVIATVRERANPTATVMRAATKPKPTRAAHKNGGGSKNGKRASSADTGDAKGEAKRLWKKGEGVKAIAAAVGRSVGSIYAWSAKEKWERPKSGAAVTPAVVAPESTQLSGSVKCTECESWTSTDPCEKCGKKLRKHWR